MDGKHKGSALQFVPLFIGVAIAIIIVTSITMPLVNSTIWRVNYTTDPGVYTSSNLPKWTGTTGTIAAQLVPLAAVIALAVLAYALMRVFHGE